MPAPAEHSSNVPAACTIAAIGASAGGLEAFKEFFAALPAAPGMAFVLIQHLSPDHPSIVSELLSKSTPMPVLQITEAVEVKPNHVYVISPNTTLTIKGGIVKPEPAREPHGFRSPIDHFFRALAADQPDRAIAVVLCGAGSDGALGLQAIKKSGGYTFAQDPATCQCDSMPRSAIATGMVDHVLPVAGIANSLVELVAFRVKSAEALLENAIDDVEANLPAICALLTDRLGHDFARYKRTTLVRRIQRRMHMLRLGPATEYLSLLDKDPKEIEQLFKDLLISVTEFFRDREAFDVLARRVIPKIFQQPNQNGAIRIWVPGCATGQEAYSLAILLREHLGRANAQHPVQIFATDLDSDALETARAGYYGEDIAEQVSRERLNRFFRQENGGYRVIKEVREMCIFSMHNVITDPPFSRMDLVSCRNVLIYFDATLQQRVIPLFHYALKAGGYLFLGPSESLGAHADHFYAIDKRLRIFQAKPNLGTPTIRLPRVDGGRSNRIVMDSTFKLRLARDRDAKELHERALLDWYAPPSVLIDPDGEVLHFIHRTGRFLEPPVGSPSHNIFDIVRNELRVALRAALNEARTNGAECIRGNIVLNPENSAERISVIVRPLSKDHEHAGEHFLIVFREEYTSAPQDGDAVAAHSYQAEGSETVQQLEHELRSTKECLHATIEELENSNEELKSSNEELISINEEYQSANESLQTSKEELQSLNEELETVNAELSKKVEELDRINADIQNLFSCTPIATLFLDQELRIKKFTPSATELFNLIDTDVGRPLLDITAKFESDPLVENLEQARTGKGAKELEIYKPETKSWYSVRISRYRTAEGQYDGLIINFVTISELKEAEQAAREALAETQRFYELGMAFASETDLEKLVQKITDAATAVSGAEFGAFFYNGINEEGEVYTLYTTSGVPRTEFDRFPMPRNTAVFEPTFRGTGIVRSDDITKDSRYGKNEPHNGMPEGHLPVVSYLAVPVVSRHGEVIGGLFFGHKEPGIFDERAEKLVTGIAGQASIALDNSKLIDTLRRSSRALQASEQRFRQLADSMPQIVWTATPDGIIDYYNRRWYDFTGFEECSDWKEIIHPEDLDHSLAAWRDAIGSGNGFEIRCRFFDRKADSYRWELGRALPVRDLNGEIIRWFGTFTNIDDLVRAESALKEAAERKDEFLAMLGHELRNPLSPVLSGLDLLNHGETSEEERDELRAMLTRQIQHLTKIVDDLLDVARISRGKILLRKQPIELVALTRSAITDYKLPLQINGLVLHTEISPEPIWIEGDPTRISQVVSNLLHNAAKFTPHHGKVQVSLQRSGNEAILSVRDTGIGMTKETILRLFQPFNQADTSLDRSRGGLGLGLALVKGLVELHGGAVTAESPGLSHGSTLQIRLPLTDQRDGSASSVAPRQIVSRRIAIIEDNVDAANTLARLLRRKGHEVYLAPNGPDGLKMITAEPVEVLLCDIGLPGEMDGYGVARQVRSTPAGQNVLMLALTGYGQDRDQQRASEAGFNFHLTKPINIDQIESILSTWIFNDDGKDGRDGERPKP